MEFMLLEIQKIREQDPLKQGLKQIELPEGLAEQQLFASKIH
jgi:hypothetical protein